MTPEEVKLQAEICATDSAAYTQFVVSLTSPPETYNLKPEVLNFLAHELKELARHSLTLDHAKRVITYGEKCRINLTHDKFLSPCEAMSYEERLLMHGLLGKITEALELVPILLAVIGGDPVDHANLLEELADDEFYEVLAMKAAGIIGDPRRKTSVLKLGSRYKGGVFTSAEALNRDLDAEREILETEVSNVR